jgi:hypothetical protein
MESMKANTESRPLAARAHASCSLAVPIRCELFDETVVSMAAVGTQLRRPLPAPLGRYGAGRDRGNNCTGSSDGIGRRREWSYFNETCTHAERPSVGVALP